MIAAPSALHVANLSSLVWLRKECQDCAEVAERLFDLEAADMRFYLGLSDAEIELLCSELDMSLFIPRYAASALPSALDACRQLSGGEGSSRDLELHNLRNLQALRELCEASTGDAVWTYRIDRQTVRAYRTLDYGDVIMLSKVLRVSAFLPRYDAAQAAKILEKPPGARAIYAAAFETEVRTVTATSRRIE